jgi:SulP family sulfate permease
LPHPAEYCLLLATFASIMQWGLEGGILAGIVLATLYFALAYAKSQVEAIQVVTAARSSVVRTVEQQVGGALGLPGGAASACW